MIAEKEKCTDSYKEKNKGAMNMSREYGYVRVSTKEQNEDRQLIAMHAVGLGTENIVVEKQSGKDFERPNYRKLLRQLREESFMQNTYNSVVLGTTDRYKYLGRGFRYGLKKSGVEWPKFDFSKGNIKQENIEAFKKIAEYCKDNDIELICVQSALPPYRLQNENMDEVHEYFTELCSEYQVPFYDLNYLKDEYLSRTDDDYVDLDGHMMGELADRQSAVLGQILISENISWSF